MMRIVNFVSMRILNTYRTLVFYRKSYSIIQNRIVLHRKSISIIGNLFVLKNNCTIRNCLCRSFALIFCCVACRILFLTDVSDEILRIIYSLRRKKNTSEKCKSYSGNVWMKSTHISQLQAYVDLLYGASRLIDDPNDAKVRQVNS